MIPKDAVIAEEGSISSDSYSVFSESSSLAMTSASLSDPVHRSASVRNTASSSTTTSRWDWDAAEGEPLRRSASDFKVAATLLPPPLPFPPATRVLIPVAELKRTLSGLQELVSMSRGIPGLPGDEVEVLRLRNVGRFVNDAPRTMWDLER